jgi:predicted protein tyrosine phosphatase
MTTQRNPPVLFLPFEDLSIDNNGTEHPIIDFDSHAASLAADPFNDFMGSDSNAPYIASQRQEDDDHRSFDIESSPSRVGIVAPGVLVASHRAISDPIVAAQYNIGALLCAAAELADTPRPPHLTHLPFLSIPLRDTAEQDLKTAVDTAVRFIKQQGAEGRTVAIYCYAGLSRSVAVALGYVLTTNPTLNVDGALGDLRSRYPVAEPNLFFLQQLSDLSCM